MKEPLNFMEMIRHPDTNTDSEILKQKVMQHICPIKT